MGKKVNKKFNTVKVTSVQLRTWLKQWENGRSKFDIEKQELGTNGRGKTVTRLWEEYLDLDTTNV